MLACAGVDFRLGGNQILADVDLNVERAETLALIGPNGAGKSSLLNCISGLYAPQKGSILLGRVDLTARRPHAIAQLGVARTYQSPQIMRDETVIDNVLLGAQVHDRMRPIGQVLRIGKRRSEERTNHAEAVRCMAEVGIRDSADDLAGSLTYPMMKLVEIARALAMKPVVLLLDEPAAGMTSQEKLAIGAVIRTLPARTGMAVIVIEHDMGFVASLADRVVVLEMGRVIATGAPGDVARNPDVVAAYLGGGGGADLSGSHLASHE